MDTQEVDLYLKLDNKYGSQYRKIILDLQQQIININKIHKQQIDLLNTQKNPTPNNMKMDIED